MASSDGSYEVLVWEDVITPARDGVALSNDVYFPARNSTAVADPLPVLLERTPYGKREAERAERARCFTRHGYAVVIQDCRGCFDSEGDLYFLRDEAADGYDAIEWIAAQPWCNGKVGTFGTSYAGWTQTSTATLNPPHLACQIPTMAGWNAHTSTVRQGGAFELRFMAWAFWHSAVNPNKRLKANPGAKDTLDHTDFRDWLSQLPLKEGLSPLAQIPNYERWLMDIYTKADYDDFWRQPGFGVEEYLEQYSDVPTYFVGAWYDSYTLATTDSFKALAAHKKGPIHAIMGPWTHGTYTTELSYSGDVDFGPGAALESFDDLHLRWFDRWLKEGTPQPARATDGESPFTFFVMGGGTGHKLSSGRMDHGGSWRHAPEWPLPAARQASYFLQADGSLNGEPETQRQASSEYEFDPNNPVPTVGGNFSSLAYVKQLPAGVDPETVPRGSRTEMITPNGGFNQHEGERFYSSKEPYLPLSSRHDVVVFQTQPLEQDQLAIGPVEVELWASSTAVDTDFTAKLVDVYPPSDDYPSGYALNIGDGIIRARYRDSREKAEFMTPNEVYRFTVTLFPISNLFVKGHRIRLDISSSNFPRFDVNPNTGEPLGRNRRTQSAINTIYHDSEHPSRLILSVVPE